MKLPRLIKIDTRLVPILIGKRLIIWERDLLQKRDPSHRAFAQVDSQLFGGRREKKATKPPSFPLSFLRSGLLS